MTRRLLLLLLAPACGDSGGSTVDGPAGGDAAGPDAPDVADAAPADASRADAPPCDPTPLWATFLVEAPSANADLFAAKLDGVTPAAAVMVNPPTDGEVRNNLGDPYRFSPDGRRLVYVADQDVRGRYELYAVSVGDAAIGPPTRVNGYLPDGERVRSYVWSPDSNEIAFLSDRLFVVNLAAATPWMPIQVQPEPTAIGQELSGDPQWAPGGGYLAYLYRADMVYELYVADSAGTQLRVANAPLLPGATSVGPFGWSPVGSRLFYVAEDEMLYRPQIFVVDVASGVAGPPTKVLGAPDFVGSVTWSPDGTRLAFLGYRLIAPGDSEIALYVADAVAPPYVARRISGPDHLGNSTTYQWSPDSSTLLYSAYPGGGYTRVFAARADLVDMPVPLSVFADPACGFTWTFGWAPAGGLAHFRATDECTGGIHLYAADLRAWPPAPGVRLTPAFSADRRVEEDVAWAPDGRTLVYRANQEAADQLEAWVVAFDDGVPRAPVKLHPPLSPFDPGGIVHSARFAADARRVLYQANQDVGPLHEIYVVEVVDGAPGASHKISGPVTAGTVLAQPGWQTNAGGCAP